jgi:hypothetical protein
LDSDAYVRLIAEWHDFYIVAGTAAATLVGLLFVGLSVNVDEVMAPDRPDLRALAEQAFASFTYVLLISLFFLVPGQDPLTIGIELAVLGVIGLLRVLQRLVRGYGKASTRQWGFISMARRLGWPALAYLGLLVVALGVAQLRPEALSTHIAVLFILLTSAADSAWDLLVKVSEDKRRRVAELASSTLAAAPGSSRPPAPMVGNSGPVSDADGAPGDDVEAPAEPEIRGRPDQADATGG